MDRKKRLLMKVSFLKFMPGIIFIAGHESTAALTGVAPNEGRKEGKKEDRPLIIALSHLALKWMRTKFPSKALTFIYSNFVCTCSYIFFPKQGKCRKKPAGWKREKLKSQVGFFARFAYFHHQRGTAQNQPTKGRRNRGRVIIRCESERGIEKRFRASAAAAIQHTQQQQR